MSRGNWFALGFGVVAISLTVVQIMNPPIPPTVGWLSVAILWALAILFFIKGIRKRENRELLIPTIDFHEYGFGLSGYREYPKETNEGWWLNLEISIDQINRSIDTLDLVIEGEYIPVNLPCKFSHIFHGYFKVSKWRYTGEHQIELIAKMGNESINSGRKSIDFNMEPFGKHQI